METLSAQRNWWWHINKNIKFKIPEEFQLKSSGIFFIPAVSPKAGDFYSVCSYTP
jgi:hypothetical protein